jgi:negative regulator of sigma E activity
MNLHICLDPTRCTALEHAHADLSAQLAAALAERDHARAALATAQQQAAHWQELYCGALEGKEFYYSQYCDKCKEATKP